jgi:hypothetical protein
MNYIKLSDCYIKLSDCKDGYLYKIHARNFSYGVFLHDGFIGIRNKFGEDYLFMEYHWDFGEPFGTVKPKQELFQLPSNIYIDEDSKELFDYLDNYLCNQKEK